MFESKSQLVKESFHPDDDHISGNKNLEKLYDIVLKKFKELGRPIRLQAVRQFAERNSVDFLPVMRSFGMLDSIPDGLSTGTYRGEQCVAPNSFWKEFNAENGRRANDAVNRAGRAINDIQADKRLSIEDWLEKHIQKISFELPSGHLRSKYPNATFKAEKELERTFLNRQEKFANDFELFNFKTGLDFTSKDNKEVLPNVYITWRNIDEKTKEKTPQWYKTNWFVTGTITFDTEIKNAPEEVILEMEKAKAKSKDEKSRTLNKNTNVISNNVFCQEVFKLFGNSFDFLRNKNNNNKIQERFKMEKRKLREGWYGADTEVEFDDSVFDDIKKYFKLPEDVEVVNAYYFVDEVTVDYEDANGKMDTIDMHVPIGIVEEWFKAGYTILDESIKKPMKKRKLRESFNQAAFNKCFARVSSAANEEYYIEDCFCNIPVKLSKEDLKRALKIGSGGAYNNVASGMTLPAQLVDSAELQFNGDMEDGEPSYLSLILYGENEETGETSHDYVDEVPFVGWHSAYEKKFKNQKDAIDFCIKNIVPNAEKIAHEIITDSWTKSGYTDYEGITDYSDGLNEAIQVSTWDKLLEEAGKLLDELIEITDNSFYSDSDGYWEQEYTDWCDRYLYYSELENIEELEKLCTEYSKKLLGVYFYFVNDEEISEIGFVASRNESGLHESVKKSNLTERFMSIHEKPSTCFNKNLKKVYEMLDKYGTKHEDVDKVFNRATLKERLEMVKLLKEGAKILKPTNYVIVTDYAGEEFLPEVYLLGWDNNEDWYTVDIDGADIMTPSGSVKKNSWGLIDVAKMISAYVGETIEDCTDYANGARDEGYDCTICRLEKDNEGNIKLIPVED